MSDEYDSDIFLQAVLLNDAVEAFFKRKNHQAVIATGWMLDSDVIERMRTASARLREARIRRIEAAKDPSG